MRYSSTHETLIHVTSSSTYPYSHIVNIKINRKFYNQYIIFIYRNRFYIIHIIVAFYLSAIVPIRPFYLIIAYLLIN